MSDVGDMDQMNDYYELYKMRRAGNIIHSRTHAHTTDGSDVCFTSINILGEWKRS